MQIIPLQSVPSQTAGALLSAQQCTLAIYQKRYGLFLDLYIGPQLILAGAICENLNRIIRAPYLGFIGEFAFADMQGSADPLFWGLGSNTATNAPPRWQLFYLEPGEYNS